MKIEYLYPVLVLAMFCFALFFLFGETPHSIEAYISPFTGGSSLISIILLTLGVVDLVYLNVSLIPKFLQNSKTYLSAIILTEIFAIFGFVIAIFNQNPWVAIPFFAVSFGNYLFIYSKIAEKTKIM